MKVLNTVDLFCGAGGASTGMEDALHDLKLTHKGLAINHWAVAVDTMRRNHPDIDTKQMSIEEAVPAELVPGGVVDLLWASPSCTHHSRAKGGKPRDNQLRAQPELVLTWLDQLRVRRVIIENVPEFVQWAPLGFDKKPLKSKIVMMDARRVCGVCGGLVKVGSSFVAWVESIKARNYDVEWKVVNCADYGDATSRRRFFLKAVRRGCGKIRWPEQTYAENPGGPDLFGKQLKKWRGVRECLDLSDLGTSIFNRERPLSKNTLRRVAVGMKKYNGMDFLMDMLGADGDDDSRVHPLTDPLPTQHSGGNRCAVVRPFVVRMNRHCNAESIDAPLSTTTTVGHHALCQPLILDHFKNGEAKPTDEPLGAQTTHDRYSVVTPYLITEQGGNAPRGIDKPLRAQTTIRKDYLCTPLVLGQQSCANARPVTEPCPTIATAGAIRVATPIILDMSRPGGHDSGHIRSADKPIQTLTTCDNVQVATPVIFDESVGLPRLPDGRYIDILLRMLKPSELAAAHSFPKDYVLTGNRGEQVKQIGNSVPVRTAAAMCAADFAAA